MKTQLRRIMSIAGYVCLVAAIVPSWSVTKKADDVARTVVSLGLPFSPLFKLERSDEDRSQPDGSRLTSFKTEWKFNFLSLSILSGLIGLALLAVCRKVGSNGTPAQATGASL